MKKPAAQPPQPPADGDDDPVWGKLIWPFTDKPSVGGPAAPTRAEPPAETKPADKPKQPGRQPRRPAWGHDIEGAG
jgi:hypothetical protein